MPVRMYPTKQENNLLKHRHHRFGLWRLDRVLERPKAGAKPFSTVKDVSFEKDDLHIRWFEDGVLNASWNCLDRHLDTRGDRVAVLLPQRPETVLTHLAVVSSSNRASTARPSFSPATTRSPTSPATPGCGCTNDLVSTSPITPTSSDGCRPSASVQPFSAGSRSSRPSPHFSPAYRPRDETW